MQYAIAEHFYSVQGEGFWTGVPMYFVRLSQCPVGKYTGVCRSWDGRSFICDTGASYKGISKTEWHPYNEVNFRMDEKEIWDLVRKSGARRLLLTGAEPFINDLTPIIGEMRHADSESIHVETSGTIPFDQHLPIWVTVSPKYEYLKECLLWANELKVLVDEDVKEEEIMSKFVYANKWTFIQPIEDYNEEQTRRNTWSAIQLVMKHPSLFRLSLQTHKFTGIR